MDEYINALQNNIQQNNAWSAEQAQKQMDFQERMSNTAHQREIADLQAAGLNPVLSAKLGGASTPSGAMSTADPSGTSALASLFSQMIQSNTETAISAIKYNSGSGYGSGYTNSARSLSTDTKFINGLLQLLGEGLPSDAKYAANQMYKIGEYVSDALGLEDSSDLKKYLTGDWSLSDTWRVVKGLFNDIKEGLGTNISDAGSILNGRLTSFMNDVEKGYNVVKDDASILLDKIRDVLYSKNEPEEGVSKAPTYYIPDNRTIDVKGKVGVSGSSSSGTSKTKFTKTSSKI